MTTTEGWNVDKPANEKLFFWLSSFTTTDQNNPHCKLAQMLLSFNVIPVTFIDTDAQSSLLALFLCWRHGFLNTILVNGLFYTDLKFFQIMSVPFLVFKSNEFKSNNFKCINKNY